MPERSVDGRTLVTDRTLEPVRDAIQNRSVGSLADYSQPTISERGVSDARLPIQTRSGVGMLSEYSQAVTYDRTLGDQRQPIIARSYSGRNTVDSTEPVTQVSVTESQPLGQTIGNYYSAGGGGGGRSYDNPISVVPGGEVSSANSNTGLILLVVVVAGGLGYWYYKKGGF